MNLTEMSRPTKVSPVTLYCILLYVIFHVVLYFIYVIKCLPLFYIPKNVLQLYFTDEKAFI